MIILCQFNLYKPNTCLFWTQKLAPQEVNFRQVSLYLFSWINLIRHLAGNVWDCKLYINNSKIQKQSTRFLIPYKKISNQNYIKNYIRYNFSRKKHDKYINPRDINISININLNFNDRHNLLRLLSSANNGVTSPFSHIFFLFLKNLSSI